MEDQDSIKSEKEFNALLNDKRHKDITHFLKSISMSLSQPQDKSTLDELKNQTIAIEKLIATIKETTVQKKTTDIDDKYLVNNLIDR